MLPDSESLRILLNSPQGGVLKETFERVMGLQRLQVAQADALKQFWRMEGMRQTLLGRVLRYLKKCYGMQFGHSALSDFLDLPPPYQKVLEELEALIGDIATMLGQLFQQIRMLKLEIVQVESELNLLNVRLQQDIATYEKMTALQVMDLFQLPNADNTHHFTPAAELHSSFPNEFDVTDVVSNQQQHGHISELQVIRLLNVLAGLQQYPDVLKALGLPTLNPSDAAETKQLLCEFREHHMYDQLMACFNRHDAKCEARYATHAKESSSYDEKIAEIQLSLDNSVASVAEFEAKLEKYEHEYESVLSKLPVPKPTMSRNCRLEDEFHRAEIPLGLNQKIF